jgi:hypothetical protein
MDIPYVYEIQIEGHLSDRWSDWFGGMSVENASGDKTVLRGPLTDQSALFGVLTKIHNLNLVLVSILRLPADPAGGQMS